MNEIVFGSMKLVRCELVESVLATMPPIVEPGSVEGDDDFVPYEVEAESGELEIRNPGDGDLVIMVPQGGILRHEGVGEVELPPGTWRLLHWARDEGGEVRLA